MKKLLLTLLFGGVAGLCSQAAIVKQWDFNTPFTEIDFDSNTGTVRPANGSGFPAESIGGVGDRFGTVAVASGSSSDPHSADNSHWRLGTDLGEDGFPEQGTANKTAGAQFRVNTSGYQNLSVTWDQENSATASRYWRVQYTTNGVDWQDHATVITANSIGNPDPDTSTPTWQLGLTADFTATPGVNNNPNFGFRLVSEYESTATGSGADAYLANRTTTTYSTAGTLWLDMVTISGDDLDPGNQWPLISALANQTTLRGEATPALALTISDAETTADNLILSASSSDPTLANTFNFGGSGENRTIVVVPEANQTGTAIITVRVVDQGGKMSESSFQITAVEPAISQIFSQFTTWDVPITVSFTIHNLPGDPASWTLTGGSSDTSKVANSGIEFGGSGTDRTVTLTPVANAIGDTVITITASTTGWQTTTNFTLRLLPDPIVDYNVSGIPNTAVASAPATFVATGLSAEDLTRGPGPAATSLTSGFSANRWNNPSSAHEPSTPSRETALTRGDYFEFSITVQADAVVSLSTIGEFNLRRSALNAPMNFEWQYSLDDFATPGVTIPPRGGVWESLGWTADTFTYFGRSATGTVMPTHDWAWLTTRVDTQNDGNLIPAIDLSDIPELQNLPAGTTVTFRLYAWGNNSTADSNTVALGRNLGPRIRGIVETTVVLVALPSGDLIYGTGQPGVGIDGRATISDPSSPDYNGATLTVTLTANGTADDRLEIRNTGSGDGQIGVSGNSVTYGGTVIGNFAGGSGTTPLVVTFNSAATPVAAEALVRNLTFRNVSSEPSPSRRSVSVDLARSGSTASATTGIQIGLLHLSDFQEGADRGYGLYSGQADIELYETQSFTAFPAGHSGAASSPRMWIDARSTNAELGAVNFDQAQALLRFDSIVGNGPGQIPAGATVVSAELILNVVDPGDGSPLYRMLTPWDAETATWDSFGGGLQPNDVMARSAFDSQLGVSLVAGETGFGSIAIGVTADVQAWVNGEANHGWGMITWDYDINPSWNRGSDGLAFNPSETPNVEDRPRLRVLWVPAGTLEASFRQGVDGYANARDTRIRQNAPDSEGSTLASVFVDWAVSPSDVENPDHVLIRFDEIIGTNPGQIPPGASIEAAMLDLATVINNGYGDGGQFFSMLTPWLDTDTWNSLGNGVQTDGVQAAATPTTFAGSAELNPNVSGGFMSFDVTPDVQAWASGTRANHGWAILPWDGGGDGWGISMSESVEERDRPRLRVFYTPGAPAAPGIVMQRPIVSPSSVQINFTGLANETYHVLRAPAVTGSWTTNGTVAADASGNATHTDNAPLPAGGFYRAYRP